MNVKVVQTFSDKVTNILHEKGKEIEITKERCAEINATSLGIFVEEIKKKVTK